MAEFDSWLDKQYGEGAYLTSSKIDWDDCNVVTPNPTGQYSTMNSVLSADALIVHEKRFRGSGSISLGCLEIPKNIIPSNYCGAFLFGAVIKKAGEDEHHIPRELSALTSVFQAYADYQYDISEYAHDKIAVISFRALKLDVDRPQIAPHWHLHDNFKNNDELYNRLCFFDTQKEHAEAYQDVSPYMVHHEAYISTNGCNRLAHYQFRE